MDVREGVITRIQQRYLGSTVHGPNTKPLAKCKERKSWRNCEIHLRMFCRFRSYREDMIFDRTYPLSSSMMSRVHRGSFNPASTRLTVFDSEDFDMSMLQVQHAERPLNSWLYQVQEAKVGRHLDFTMQTARDLRQDRREAEGEKVQMLMYGTFVAQRF